MEDQVLTMPSLNRCLSENMDQSTIVQELGTTTELFLFRERQHVTLSEPQRYQPDKSHEQGVSDSKQTRNQAELILEEG